MYGIEYTRPTVTLLHASPLVNAELAGRVCYDSFGNSEHKQVQEFDGTPIEDVEHSELLDSLCHVYHHMSIAEHANLTYLIKGTSRGVLQEHARHRIQAISVRSTRYTMSSVINAFIASNSVENFIEVILSLDMFVVTGKYAELEARCIYDRLVFQYNLLGEDEFFKIALSKDALTGGAMVLLNSIDRFEALQLSKKKRNVGDAFKHLVTDNWKVDMVVTMNLRALKNYFQLRDSGSAYFQIRWLAEEMKKATPKKYLDLIVKNKDK